MALRYALLIIGIVIVAVIAFHTLDGARLRRRRNQNLTAAPSSSTASQRLEPVSGLDFDPLSKAAAGKRTVGTDSVVEAPPSAVTRNSMQEELETIEEVATMPLNLGPGLSRRTPLVNLSRSAVPDDKVDFILRLPAESSVMRDVALGVYKQHEYELEKPHRLYGCRVESDLWTELQYDSQRTRYGDLALSIQLVDSRGPIDESELNKFSQVGLRLADTLYRRTQFSMSFEEAIPRAADLHRFCEEYDVIAAIHIMALEGAQFKGRMLEHGARKLGMQWGARSIFHMKNDFSPGCRHLFSLANLTGSGEFPAGQWDGFDTTGVTFFMSVPCAHRPAMVFDKMITAAQGLAETLNGQIHDQTRRPLTNDGTNAIRRQIEAIEERMRARGIVPGSQTALRLFADEAVD